MVLLAWSLSILYFLLIATFVFTWSKIPCERIDTSEIKSNLKISIIIPVRNEETTILNLLDDIRNQHYPQEKYEVFIIDDHSTDSTSEKVTSFIKGVPNFFLIPLKIDAFVNSYKKKAIELGVQAASGDIIVTTDGDCRIGANWLKSINEMIVKTGAVCLCGPVTYSDNGTIFSNFQTIELAALLGSGAATISRGLPGMCNGANLIYKKEAFLSVQGFTGIDGIASGDDELLMHKLLEKYPNDVHFFKSREAIVSTKPNQTASELFHQRKRWAGKWSYYKSPFVIGLAVFVFVFNLYIALGGILILTGLLNWKLFLFHLFIKVIIESVFIIQILIFLKKKIHLFHLVLLQILYPFYTVFFGIVANFGGYEWKGRKVNGK